MSDYYHLNFQDYHDRTFYIDPSSFLTPLVEILFPNSRILDVGCGSGRDVLWLIKKGFQIIGLERSSGLAKQARANTGCRIIEGDFRYFDFSRLSMNAVLLIGSLVHMPYDAFPAILGKILKAVPSGHILISMKAGSGITSDGHGRTFYLWEDADLRKWD